MRQCTVDPTNPPLAHLGDGGPAGIVTAVYDSANHLIVAAPINRKAAVAQKDMVTWVLKLPADVAGAEQTPQWEARATPDAPECRQTGFAFDERTRKCVLFTAGQTWTYDATANVWEDVKPKLSPPLRHQDRKSTRLNSSHLVIS